MSHCNILACMNTDSQVKYECMPESLYHELHEFYATHNRRLEMMMHKALPHFAPDAARDLHAGYMCAGSEE